MEAEQKEMSINDIKKGTHITRVQPAKPYKQDGQGDRSYMGDKLLFKEIANGQIYLARTGTEKKIFGNELIDLPVDLWSDGWVEFIDVKK